MNLRLAFFLAGCLASAPLCALEKEGPVITLTDEEDALCEDGGGCIVAPKDELYKAFEVVRTKAYEEGMNACHGRDRL
jgi:hypothetical protein